MAHLVEGGDVDAADLRELAEHLVTGGTSVAQLAMTLTELDDLLLALADHHAVENGARGSGL